MTHNIPSRTMNEEPSSSSGNQNSHPKEINGGKKAAGSIMSNKAGVEESNNEFFQIMKRLESDMLDVEEDDQLFFFQPVLEKDEDDLEPPFLPAKKGRHRFTIVLDLDETLVHFEEVGDNGQFLVRPYAQQFLTEMGKYFEVVIFTAALQEVIFKNYYFSTIPKTGINPLVC